MILGADCSMRFQRCHISIVRSIRQVSLVRDWLRARAAAVLPCIATFEPDQRAGDALDLSLFTVARHNDTIDYVCLHAGERVRTLHDTAMWGRSLQTCLDAGMAAAAMPIWDACVATRLPVYSIMAIADPQGCPVTVEQIVLPYSRAAATPDFIVASLHAWSTEGRFQVEGLLRGNGLTPSHWAAVIDPAAAAVTASMHDGSTGPEDWVLEDHGVCAVI